MENVKTGQFNLLAPGRHLLEKGKRQFIKKAVTNQKRVDLANFDIVTIDADECGLVKDNMTGTYHLMQPGQYYLQKNLHTFVKSEKLNQPIVDLAPYTIVTVNAGQVAETYDNGELIVFEPGVHTLKHAQHTCKNIIDTTSNDYSVGVFRYIRILPAETGLALQKGKLAQLNAGKHTIDTREEVFIDKMSTQQQEHEFKLTVSTSRSRSSSHRCS